MNAEHRELLQEAIRALKLRDIMLYECGFRRPSPPPVGDSLEARQQAKRSVKFVIGDGQDERGETIRLLQVMVELGLRVTGLQEKDAPVYFEIEADFMVEYELKSDVSQEALKVFTDFNSVHNVWPFWRQHVYDTVSRARLPQFDIPLYSGVPPARQLQVTTD